jgi:translation elongation factor EF-G
MKACDADGPVMVQVGKLYHTTDAQSFRAFGRVLSGTLKKGMSVKVLGEGYSPEDEEDMMKSTVEDIWINEARYVCAYMNQMAKLICVSFVGTSSQPTKYQQGTWFLSVESTRPFPKLRQ